MPRREDLKSVLVIGSGPIVIGQACEFDYSGTQACRVLKAEGLRVTLVNSNPATIMTDPEFADATYVEPITVDFVEKVIAREAEQGNKIDAVLATLGGQTALNTAVALHERGILAKYDVELIGADFDAIQRGEDRQKFKDIVAKVGGESARSRVCFTMEEVRDTVAELGYPVETATIRPRLEALLVHPNHLVTVAAGPNVHLSGFVVAEYRSLLLYGAQVEIMGLCVGSDARRMGVGRALVALVEKWAQQFGDGPGIGLADRAAVEGFDVHTKCDP